MNIQRKQNLEEALDDIKHLNSKITQLTNTLEDEKDEVVKTLTQRLNEAIEEKRMAENMMIMQMNVELDTPPEKEWEENLIKTTKELETVKETLKAKIKESLDQKEKFSNKVEELEKELKELQELNENQENRNKLEVKELSLMLETSENKLKEAKLDIIKLISALDRKEIDIKRLNNIIKQLETQKMDFVVAVRLYVNI